MARLENRISPGIGEAGEIVISNKGTRAVLVADSIITGKKQLRDLTYELSCKTTTLTNRRVVKTISTIPLVVSEQIDGSPFTCEACLPFKANDEQLYWIVTGHNTPPRLVDHAIIGEQKEQIIHIVNDPNCSTQSGDELADFVFKKNRIRNLGLFRITRDNFELFETGLSMLYDLAFGVYPYDPVSAIRETCSRNVFVVATVNNEYPLKVVAVTGAEIMQHPTGVTLAEIGDSASLEDFIGFGPLMKRFLMEILTDTNILPNLLFTDSRIGQVLKANQRAGLKLTRAFLPLHTEISSPKDPQYTKQITGENKQPVTLENMTMTYTTPQIINEVLEKSGRIPNSLYNQS